jgi:hypothetical protein
MTALHAGGYGVIILTPNRMLDWTNGPATATWEMSTHRESTRDWVDFWLSPFSDALVLPISDAPDLQPESPRSGQWLQINGHGNITGFKAATHNGVIANYGPLYQADSRTQRDKFQITIDRDQFSFCKLTGEPSGQPVCFMKDTPHGLGFTQAIFQIGHHSYTPTKGECFQLSCTNKGAASGLPTTMHWDNVVLSPSVPFTIIKADRRAILGPSGTVNFNAPAPAGAVLRFSAIGRVMVDGQVLNPQRPTMQYELLNTYAVPITSGKQSVNISLSCNGWYCGPYQAKDFHVWSRSQSAPSGPAATATAVPSSTPPATNPTATSTPRPATPTAAPTRTPTPIVMSEPWRSSATVFPATVKQGTKQSIQARVTSATKAVALIDIEVYGPDGGLLQQAHQTFFNNVTFRAGTPKTLKLGWEVPDDLPPGKYTVHIGVFQPGWGVMHDWNHNAATFTVVPK